MAQPILPIQTGGNLPGLDREEDIEQAAQQDAEMQAYEDALGLDPNEVEQEIIEQEDGSVIITGEDWPGLTGESCREAASRQRGQSPSGAA